MGACYKKAKLGRRQRCMRRWVGWALFFLHFCSDFTSVTIQWKCPYMSIVSGHRSFNVISNFHYHIPPSEFLVGYPDGSGFPLLQGTPRKRAHKNEANGAGKNEMVPS